MAATADKAVAIIPARGGSKRVPGKNLLPVGGRPLIAHSILHALNSTHVDEVYVSTDDDEIAAIARETGAEVAMRSRETARDRASSESALLEVLDRRLAEGQPDPELVVFLQCTSPVRGKNDVDAAIERLLSARADSLFSACADRGLLWEVDNGLPRPLNWNLERRPFEQDMTAQQRENGSIYVFRPEVLRRGENRLGGKIAVHEMDYWSSFQLDRPEDAELLDWILSRHEYGPAVEWPERIDLVVFDFDGVMTDNRLFVNERGGEGVICNRGDGLGIGRLRAAGVPMMVISTEANPVVGVRCRKLGIPCHQDVSDKGAYLRRLLDEEGIDPAMVAFVGNDVNDLDCLDLVGLPVVVADAEAAAVKAAKIVLSRNGGDGAVREFCDQVLRHVGSQSGRAG